jgi:CRP/FNR family transcriptional regulator
MARPRPIRATRELPARTFEAGQVIFRQGDPMHGEAYMVHEGKVEVRRSGGGTERALRTLVKGDLLGEVAFFRNAPHSVTAVAAERVTLHVISADRLDQMVRGHPDLAVALIRQLAQMAANT